MSLPPGAFGGGYCLDLLAGCLNTEAHPWFAQNLQDVRVSAHFFIDRSGRVTQLVDTDDRAWHAGASAHHGRVAFNDFSVGIELEGDDETAFTDAQYASLNPLLDWLVEVHAIDWVLGHSDIAPGRKTDPGPHFDWSRLSTKRGRQE